MRDFRRYDVWSDGIDFVTAIYEVTDQFPPEERFGLTSQMRRAAVSMPSNVAEGASRKLVGLHMDGRYIARHDYPIFVNGERSGIVTSGTMSPTLGKAIALAYVPTAFAKPGQIIEVEIRGKLHSATVVKKPFYKRGEG